VATSFNRLPGADPKTAAALESAANDGIESVNVRLDLFRKAVARVGRELQSRLLAHLADPLKQSSAANILHLQAELTGQLNQLGYSDLVQYFTNSFDASQKTAAEAAAAIGVTKLSPLDQAALHNLKSTSYAWLQQIGQQAVAEVAQGVAMNALVGGGKKNMVDRIRQALNKFQNHASTYAETAIATYDREVHWQMFTAAGVQRMVYTGPKDIKNRDFCRHLVGKAWNLEEISKMDNGTTLMPVSRFGGGWNCRHVWMPAPEQIDEAGQEAKAAVESAGPVDLTGAVTPDGLSMMAPFPLAADFPPSLPPKKLTSKVEWVRLTDLRTTTPAVSKAAVQDAIATPAGAPPRAYRYSGQILIRDSGALARATADQLLGRSHLRVDLVDLDALPPKKPPKPKVTTPASLVKDLKALAKAKDQTPDIMQQIDAKTAQLGQLVQPLADKASAAVTKANIALGKAKSEARIGQAKKRLEKAQRSLDALREKFGQYLPDLFPEAEGSGAPGALNLAKVDGLWAKTRRAGFTYESEAVVGGGHGGKQFYRDNISGEKWLFKPIKNQQDTFLAAAEESAYRVARMVDPATVEVRAIALDGRLGTIQRMISTAGSLAGVPVEALTAEQVVYLQRQHVIDWLTSNHDGHRKQFLRMADGQLLEIDRGQAWKYFGKDALSIDYHPNSMYGEEEPIYNTLLRAAQRGRVKLDPQAAFPAIRAVEAISDTEFLEAVREYVDRLPFKSATAKQQFVDGMVARKNGIRADFERFYQKTLGKPDFRFSEGPKWKFLDARNAAALEEVSAAGWQGKTLYIDAEAIEDHNVLVFEQQIGDRTQTVLQFKLRPEASEKLFRDHMPAGFDAPKASPGRLVEIPKSTVSNKQLQMLIDGQITPGQIPAKDGWGNPITPEKKQILLQELADYKTRLAEAEAKLKAAEKLSSAVTTPEHGFQITATEIQTDSRRLHGGALLVEKPDVSFQTIGGAHSSRGEGLRFESDGIKVRATSTRAGAFSHAGRVEVVLDGPAGAARIDADLERLGALGVDMRSATAIEEEWVYLQQHAYLHKIDLTPEWKAISADTSSDVRVQKAREFWSKRLKVADVTKLPQYQPLGREKAAWNSPTGLAGHRIRERFDITAADLDANLKGLVVAHADTSGDFIGTLDAILQTTRQGLATEERLRLGIRGSSMSPQKDIQTGGASYFFTSMRHEGSPGQYYGKPFRYFFKKDVLLRLDTISYQYDSFGNVQGSNVRNMRLSASFQDMRNAAGGSANETIFKNGLNFLDDIDHIRTADANERGRVIALFRKHGIETLRDGRRVEDIVTVGFSR